MKKVLIFLALLLLFVLIAVPVTSYPLHLLHTFFNSEYNTRLEIGTTVVVVGSVFVLASLIRAFFKVCENLNDDEDETV